ncbi:MAG TPA: hypothetical protein VMF29_05005, partial [Candidatus Edwardsbacteria bacterium]|nr:hypothetical protein [Candidatus Edwardsbacteria bacterium]
MPTLNVIRALAVAAALAAAAGPALSQPADTAAARAAAGGAQPMAYSPADSGRPFTVYHVKPDSDYLFYRPRAFEYWPRAVQNLGTFGRTALRRDNLVMLAPIAAATAALWVLDEPIKDGVQRLGDRLHISGHNTDRTRTYLAVKGLPIFRGPSDLGSALYFIGDGWIHIGITTGFYAYGQIAGDDRARQTTSQLLQGLGVTGTVIQILKRSTGRESPGCATAQGGRWRL